MPLLRCNRCGHPTRTHLSQSRRAGEPAPTAPSYDLPHSQAAWGPSSNRERRTLPTDKNLRMDVVVRRGGHRNAPNPEYRDKPILVNVTHADPQAQVHLRTGSANHDGSAASTSEARADTTLDRDMCLSTSGAITNHFRGGKLWAPRGRR